MTPYEQKQQQLARLSRMLKLLLAVHKQPH
jgi:hypothetical protein